MRGESNLTRERLFAFAGPDGEGRLSRMTAAYLTCRRLDGAWFLRVAVGLTVLAVPTHAADWPQLQGNAGHTGWTADVPKPPYRLKWARPLGEPTFPGAPVIVAQGLVFTGTAWGNLLALDRETGQERWRFKTGASITSTPACEGGLVYVTSMDRHCYAVEAGSGKLQWRFETEAGLSAGPVVASDKVFCADREGWAYALDANEGRLLWRQQAGGMALATPAFANGQLFVAGGDNRIRAFDAETGEVRWTSPVLPGAAIRDYWVVAARGVVIATTQLAYNAHGTYEMIERAIMAPWREAHDGEMLVQDELLEKLAQWFEEHPHQRTVHVLDAQTGRVRCQPPIVSVHGGGCVGPLPVLGPHGPAYAMYANVRLQASGWAFAGQFDLDTGRLAPLIRGRYWIDARQWEWQPKPGSRFSRRSPFDTGFCVNDQSWGLSLAGRRLFTVRDPGWPDGNTAYGWIDVRTGQDAYLVAETSEVRRALQKGCFGGAFHATCAPLAISGSQLFHKAVRNVVLCFEGKP